jgi:hypothetical protein
MTDPKLLTSVGLAATVLALALTYLIGRETVLLQTGIVGIVSIITLVLAIAAFVVSWRHRSFLVAGLLGLSGIFVMIPTLIALADINFAVIAIPGPILGVILGKVMLGLGVAKGVMTARTVIGGSSREF